ncbi:FAD-dependent oxidoreductase [Histidinibacterium lentulum]|uniref:FAD-dependent monooxygenase n=1 Tax=Histidinibacterium lentulum TaxID=2480588 RepID=A0A3N2QUQ4_9RHOB|nr:NAD(P)/FAD-dependent oxidoreductase [Histidinibacterium lentulum]ROT98936.1 FAD-dependent monooxygenase [Histidinibacterium lentulum]
MDIAVAGAGIGGLAAAAAFHDAGHRVTLYDQFAAPAPVGSGLVIQPVGLAVLDALGAGAAVRAAGAPLRRLLGRESETGRPVLDVSYGAEPGLGIHRAALFDALLATVRARGIPLVTSAEVTGHAEGRLLLADGESPRAELIVDALGAGSPLSPLRSRPLPYGAIWGTVDWPEDSPLPRDRLSQRYRRADRMLGILPVGRLPGERGDKAAIFWSLRADGHGAWREAGLETWLAETRALWPEAEPFFGQIAEPAQMTMARYSHGTLRRPHGARLVHIGDAAHRASPQLGQGANMALLDALALARALAVHPHCLPDALVAHAKARRWHVRAYQGMSALFTPQYQSDSRVLPVLRDRVLFPLSRVPPIPAALSRLVSGTLLPPVAGLGPGPAVPLSRPVPDAPTPG